MFKAAIASRKAFQALWSADCGILSNTFPGLNFARKISSLEGGELSSGVESSRRSWRVSASDIYRCRLRDRRARVSSATNGVDDGPECGRHGPPGGQARRSIASRLSFGRLPLPGKRSTFHAVPNLQPAAAVIAGVCSSSWARPSLDA